MPARKIAPESRRFAAKFPVPMLEWLEAEAQCYGCSIAELLRQAVEGLGYEPPKTKEETDG